MVEFVGIFGGCVLFVGSNAEFEDILVSFENILFWAVTNFGDECGSKCRLCKFKIPKELKAFLPIVLMYVLHIIIKECGNNIKVSCVTFGSV